MKKSTLILLKTLTWVACLWPLGLLVYQAVTNTLGPDPTANITFSTGLATLRLLTISLAITPVRIVAPWKYGFKSAKSIVAVRFVDKMPPTTWNDQAPREYGFYSNVNPSVDHPRWSQKTERRIGLPFYAQRKTTLLFNGYGEQVASLYNGMNLKRDF